MTNAEKKAWLWRYQDSLRQEKELAEEVEQLRARACRVSPAFTGMPGAQGDGQALPRAVEKILQAQLELQQQIQSLQTQIEQLQYAEEAALGAEVSLRLDAQILQTIRTYRGALAADRLDTA